MAGIFKMVDLHLIKTTVSLVVLTGFETFFLKPKVNIMGYNFVHHTFLPILDKAQFLIFQVLLYFNHVKIPHCTSTMLKNMKILLMKLIGCFITY